MDNKQLLAKLAINKSLLKEYSNSECSRVVYMRNNSEFQIQIFNPYSYTIGAEVYINGKSLQNKLVVRPGQRVWLERYFDSPNKFLFTTYEVNGNNDQVKEAIKNNGEIKIQFYKEQEPKIYVNNDITYTVDKSPWWQNYQTYCAADVKLTADLCSDYSTNHLVGTKLYCNSNDATTLGMADFNSNKTSNLRCMTKPLSKKIETGRVERGNHSDQNFNTINIDFEYFAFSEEIIKILPESQKPIFKNDLTKQYCSNCGRKLNQKYKYCPYCGAKVDFCPNNQNQHTNQNYTLEKCPYCGRRVRSNMMECPHCGEILR